MVALLQDAHTRRTITVLLLIIGGVLTFARLAVELLWFVSAERESGESAGIDALLVVLSLSIVGILAGLVVIVIAPRVGNDLTSENVTGWVTSYAIAMFSILFLSAITPWYVVRDTPQDIITVLTGHIVGIGVFASTVALYGFLYYVLSSGRSRRDRRVHIVLAVHVLAIWLCQTGAQTVGLLSPISWILLFSGCIVVVASVKRQRWLVTLSTSTRLRMMWSTAFAAVAAFAAFITLWFSTDSVVTQAVTLFVPVSSPMLAATSLLGTFVLIRLFGALLVSLPNSGVVHRRSNEVKSIMELNRLVMETRNHDQLFIAVTQMARDVCQAHGSWIELYGPSGILTIKGQYLVQSSFIESLHAEYDFKALATVQDSPLVIPSVDDYLGRRGALPGIGSVIFVPLIDEGQRIGTLVVFSTVDFGLDGDDERLLTAFGDQIRLFLEQYRLQMANAASERLQQEFRVARTIQVSLLPQRPPADANLDVYAVMIPAYEVGGDYYDYVRFPDGTVGFVIADVSGKGIPAALYMATLKGAVLSAMRVAHGPADLLCRLNATLFKNMRPGIYITMMCIAFDQHVNVVRVARAGHMPLLVVREGSVTSHQPPGLAIGLADAPLFDATLQEIQVRVHWGDVMVLTTDGVTERRNPSMEELGVEALAEALASAQLSSAEDAVHRVLVRLDAHGQSTDPHDDLTIVAVRCTHVLAPAPASASIGNDTKIIQA